MIQIDSTIFSRLSASTDRKACGSLVWLSQQKALVWVRRVALLCVGESISRLLIDNFVDFDAVLCCLLSDVLKNSCIEQAVCRVHKFQVLCFR